MRPKVSYPLVTKAKMVSYWWSLSYQGQILGVLGLNSQWLITDQSPTSSSSKLFKMLFKSLWCRSTLVTAIVKTGIAENSLTDHRPVTDQSPSGSNCVYDHHSQLVIEWASSCLLLFYAIATVFQLYHDSDMMHEMRRKPEPTCLPT